MFSKRARDNCSKISLFPFVTLCSAANKEFIFQSVKLAFDELANRLGSDDLEGHITVILVTKETIQFAEAINRYTLPNVHI